MATAFSPGRGAGTPITVPGSDRPSPSRDQVIPSLFGASINPKLGYDPRADYDYLGIVSTTPNIVFARKDFPANTLAEFIASAKAKGKDLKMGHSGIGAASHITCVLLFQLIGAEPTYVTYRGFGQTINDILGGSIDGSCDLARMLLMVYVAHRDGKRRLTGPPLQHCRSRAGLWSEASHERGSGCTCGPRQPRRFRRTRGLPSDDRAVERQLLDERHRCRSLILIGLDREIPDHRSKIDRERGQHMQRLGVDFADVHGQAPW